MSGESRVLIADCPERHPLVDSFPLRSLQDGDGRGHHIKKDNVMFFAISNHSASFGFQHCP